MTLELMQSDVVSCVSAFLPWGPDLFLKVTAVSAGILLAGSLAGRRRAALRHLICTLGLGGLVLLGALSFRLPQGGTLLGLVTAVWGTIAVALGLRLLIDLALLSWHVRSTATAAGPVLSRRAANLAGAMGIRRPVSVLLGREAEIPHTWGLLRPVIVLPRRAVLWTRERLDAVLLHELGHVRRCDPLSSVLSRVAGAIYWFHPLVWWMRRRAREDAERACDALAIEHGLSPVRYARHLLALIRDTRRARASLAPAISAESDLARRIGALLESRSPRIRFAAWRVGRLAAVSLVVAVLLPTVLLAGLGTGGADGARQNETPACLVAPEESLLPDLASEEPRMSSQI